MKRIIVLSLGLVFITACCKDEPDNKCYDASNPDCENYDPCFGKSPVSANFTMSERLGNGPPEMNTLIADTNFTPKARIVFKAHEKNAYYKWYLGTEIIEGYGDSVVERNVFDLPPGRYPAVLVVQKAPDSVCHPMDDGRDSILRYFTVLDWCDLMIHNRFKGVFEDTPNDSVEIEFYFANLQGTQRCAGSSLYVTGLFTAQQDPANKWDPLYISGGGGGTTDSYLLRTSNGGFTCTTLLDRGKKSIDFEFTYNNSIERKFNGIVKN
jgi:hypothetical protein